MYKTKNNWNSARNCFYKIISKLPIKLVDNDKNLNTVLNLIYENNDNSTVSVCTESQIDINPYYKLWINEENLLKIKDPKIKINYFLSNNYGNNGLIEYTSYNCYTNEFIRSIIIIDDQIINKFNYQIFGEEVIYSELSYFDLRGNILNRIMMNNKQIINEIYEIVDDESKLVDIYQEYGENLLSLSNN